jgi:universal stress protein A
MKSRKDIRRIAETVVGASVGAAIAGPAGAVAGGLIGREATRHTADAPSPESIPSVPKHASSALLAHVHPRRILVPIDFSSSSDLALEFAREWAGEFGAELMLLHVVEPPPPATLTDRTTFFVTGFPDLETESRSELGRLANEDCPDSKVSIHIRQGISFDEIVAAARELQADLIIMPTHGRTGLAHVLMGSTAEHVVRYALCPVLTLRTLFI